MARYSVHRIDKNQPEIIEEFESCGASVTPLTGNGNGVADLLVGYRGFSLPVEVKTANGKLNSKQLEWHKTHEGLTFVVRTATQARFLLMAIDVLCKRLKIDRLQLPKANSIEAILPPSPQG